MRRVACVIFLALAIQSTLVTVDVSGTWVGTFTAAAAR